MNIQEAKEEIKRTVEIYLDQDEYGQYSIPYMKQRPIFLLGAPGIGKTAIMEQVAAELDLALVSYSMTHHTRQSAIGLPFITEMNAGGEMVKISEYTMSEIIASVYRVMERSGKHEGILFLDEINCVSETLAPLMLLFLQYKTFGNRRLPEGWIIVTAGNPPQYNRSVREFDIATRDRLKCISVTEDFSVWKTYGYGKKIHSAILSFLEINKEWFYSIRTSADGPVYVTARGWEDLSNMLRLYEKKGFFVDLRLIEQYVTDMDIARRFAIYYDLYKKYREDYQVDAILSGTESGQVLSRAKEAAFDERIALLELITEQLNQDFAQDLEEDNVLGMVVTKLRLIKKDTKKKDASSSVSAVKTDTPASASVSAAKKDAPSSVSAMLTAAAEELEEERIRKSEANSFDIETGRIYTLSCALFREYASVLTPSDTAAKQFASVKRRFDSRVKRHEKHASQTEEKLEHAFGFVEKAWGNGQEMLLFMTTLTANRHSSSFIHKWGSDSYYRHNSELLVYDIHQKLQDEIRGLEL